jgi:peptidyl-prolyl cis-trans isomerase SurA
VAALSGGLLISCRATPSTQGPAAVSADTWATVDGRAITRDAVETAYRRSRDESQTLSDEEVLAAKLSLLNEMIVQDILVAKARELKIDVADSELDTAYDEAKKNITPSDFQEELGRRKVTAADMREGLRREMLARKVMEREVGSKSAPSEQEVTDFFNANKARFNIAEESYALAQIVVTPVADPQVANRSGDDATTAEAAAAKTRMLMDRLKTGASFRELAVNFSEDPESAPRGGDLGLVPVSRLAKAPPAMRDAVLKKTPGTATVVSLGGAHTIVLVVAHEPAGQRDLSMPAVRDGITSTLRARKEQVLRAAYLTTVQTDANVVNHLARRLVENQGKMPDLRPLSPAGK